MTFGHCCGQSSENVSGGSVRAKEKCRTCRPWRMVKRAWGAIYDTLLVCFLFCSVFTTYLPFLFMFRSRLCFLALLCCPQANKLCPLCSCGLYCITCEFIPRPRRKACCFVLFTKYLPLQVCLSHSFLLLLLPIRSSYSESKQKQRAKVLYLSGVAKRCKKIYPVFYNYCQNILLDLLLLNCILKYLLTFFSFFKKRNIKGESHSFVNKRHSFEICVTAKF